MSLEINLIHMPTLTKSQWIAVAVSVVIVGFYFYYDNFVSLIFNQEVAGVEKTENINMANNNQSGELIINDIMVGTGAEALAGKEVSVHYVGTFGNGDKFDSSYDRNQPFQFILGQGMVIQGWEKGILGMKVGGKRHLVIPPSLGYGPADYGPIPGNSTLIFDVELIAVE